MRARLPRKPHNLGGLPGFSVLQQLGFQHEVLKAPKGNAGIEIEPYKWLNVLLGHLKTAFSGTVINFVFGHNMLQRCMYADQKETGP